MYDAGRIRWPAFDVDRERFLLHVAALGESIDPDATLSRADDLYLAFACAEGDRAAIDAFEHDQVARVSAYLERFSREPAFIEEVRQFVRVRLLVGEPGRSPRIATYSGRGPLAAWVRVTAVRAAIELCRSPRVNWPSRLASESLRDCPHPELGYIKELYRGDFEACFEAGVAALSKRERTLLKLHYVDRLSFPQIGALYGATRSTAHRWFVSIRERLLRDTERRLHERLDASAQEIESLENLLKSELGVTLSRLLGATR